MESHHLTGRVRSVDTVEYGDVLDGDHAIGVTTLQLQDAADFDEDGGSLRLNGVVLKYTAADLDLDTLTLAVPLAVASLDGDAVSSWDEVSNAVSSDLFALVAVDGTDTADDALEAIVDHPLAPLLPEGIRGTIGEAVELRYRGDDLFVTGIRGRAPLLPGFVNDDTSTWSGLGDLTLPLSKTPKPGSLQIKLNGHELEPSAWTLDPTTNTVTYPANTWMDAGEVLTAYYAYDATVSLPDAHPTYVDAVLGFSPIWFGVQTDPIGSIALIDQSGHGRDGTYENGVTLGASQIVPNMPGTTCASYDGSNDFGTVPYGTWLNTTQIAVVAWIYLDSTGAIQTVYARNNLVGWGSTLFTVTAAGKLRFEVATASGIYPVVGSTTLSPGTVYMVSGIYDGSTVEVFLNDTSDGSASANGALNTSLTYGAQVGGAGVPGAGLTYILDGRIGPVALFDPSTFTRSDIPTLYTAGVTT